MDEVEEIEDFNNSNKKRNLIVFAFVVAALACGALLYWLHARQFEQTDDAQIDGNMSPISARVEGTIVKVYADNNQLVHAGDLLAELDPQDHQVRLDEMRAQLDQAESHLNGDASQVPITEVNNVTDIRSARAQVESAQASVAVAERDRDQARAQTVAQKALHTRAQSDLARYRKLIAKQEVSKIEFDQVEAVARQQAASFEAATAALASAERNVDMRRAQLEQANSVLLRTEKIAAPQLSARMAAVGQQKAALEASKATLKRAELDLSYTKIYAPVTGIVLKRSAQIGARVAPGQQLLTISQSSPIWVTANFKETQLLHMRPGQPVKVHVDALNRDFKGTVESIGGATGSVSSLLPPENATGNYVKVVQRIPVRIQLPPGQADLDRVRQGMSVEPSVRVL